jgi:hypothetical protein
MTDVDTTIEYYKDLLLYQYINAPNARAVTGLLCSQAIADLVPISVRDAFDIETATGPQLDIIGEYVGVSRLINVTIARDYFTFEDSQNAATTLYGFTDYSDITLNANVTVYEYVDNSKTSSALIDAEYRILLKLKVLLNISNNSLYDINIIFYDFFGTDITILDQLDMSMSYFVKSTISRIIGIAKDQNLLPKPMGVLSNVFVVDSISTLWALSNYGSSDNFTLGFSDYVSGFLDAKILGYNDRI